MREMVTENRPVKWVEPGRLKAEPCQAKSGRGYVMDVRGRHVATCPSVADAQWLAAAVNEALGRRR